MKSTNYRKEKYWLLVGEFVEELRTAKYWLKPDGKPKKEWVLFERDTLAAAWDAAWDAARDAACNAARNAARDAACNAAWDAARDAARDAAWDAAWDAARDALRPTVVQLQTSALDLVERMIAVTA